jgi:hypothetical protein
MDAAHNGISKYCSKTQTNDTHGTPRNGTRLKRAPNELSDGVTTGRYLLVKPDAVSMSWLNSDVALVTGGASGLGRAIVERFIEEGASVGVLDVSPQRLKTLSDEFGDDVVVHFEV